MASHAQTLLALLQDERTALLKAWTAATHGGRASTATRQEAEELFDALQEALQSGTPDDMQADGWAGARQLLEALSASRAAQGQSAGDTSAFVLALKLPIFTALQQRLGKDTQTLLEAVLSVTTKLDTMAQWTATAFQRTREELINRQQEELLELSTPVIKLWEGVLAVPMIGTLDSSRTQMVMEALLQKIVDTESELAIIDITGVPTVDTLVAQHLLKTVTAIRLMGADCIISGVRPQIAQTIVHLGVDLQGVTTKSSLAAALALALKRGGWNVARTA
ncbi:STAS domain-containing protein [Pseudorhodoferax sp. Leaf274]|uniref:STAS domain-containing protein n=1 Tax=Pseudorhodoferax sp. Leaf274 TaxID=1736318 RepID=UPI0007037593|nr:STAS domain-containing protein [Pseudorhodoferax sp. Leaf274]KQP44189.1 polyvinylalcohol dehydrogenase [Pseudorhodoferax sp. Leaf274]